MQKQYMMLKSHDENFWVTRNGKSFFVHREEPGGLRSKTKQIDPAIISAAARVGKVQMIEFTGNEFGTPSDKEGKAKIRKDSLAYVRNNFAGKDFANPTAPFPIGVRVAGTKHTLTFSGDIRKAQILMHLDTMLQQGVYVREEKPDPRKAHKPNVVAYHKLIMPVSFGGQPSLVKITLQQDNNGHLFYDNKIKDIEIIKPVGLIQGVSADASETYHTQLQRALFHTTIKMFDYSIISEHDLKKAKLYLIKSTACK